MNIVGQMKLFLEPRSIAIVGVSRHFGEDVPSVLANLINFGFSGEIYPVNPNADEILGVKTYHSIKEVPGKVDLAVIATPRDAVLPIVKDCLAKNIKALIILAQGFADGDREGAALQQEIVELARGKGARVIGPNTFGVANAFTNLTSAFRPMKMEIAPIGLICQTGVFL